MVPTLQFSLGLTDLTLLAAMNAFGSTAATMLQYAAYAISCGQARVVACVYADAPLTDGRSISQSAYNGKGFSAPGFAGLRSAYGDFGPANPLYALAAAPAHAPVRDDHEQLGAIAVGQREWAQMNPRAQMRQPMTLDDHQLALDRGAAAPVRLLPGLQRRRRRDRHLGRAGARPAPAAGVSPRLRTVRARRPERTGREPGLHTGAGRPGRWRWRRRASSCDDIDVLELYDCYTYTVLVTLEDYGFCAKGEGGAVRRGRQARPRRLAAVNTGGGQLSSYYMWGFTPLSEAVIQARGQGGERQVAQHDHRARLAATAASSTSTRRRSSARSHDRRMSSGRSERGASRFRSGWKVRSRTRRAHPSSPARRAGQLMLMRCGSCETFMSPTAYLGVPVRPRCLHCFSPELHWTPSSGRATLYSFAIMHQLYDEAFAAEVPYNIAVVETEEGVRLTSQVIDCPNDELRIGMPLQVTFERRSDDVSIPMFKAPA